MADKIEIYDADNQDDWNAMNEKLLVSLQQAGILRQDEHSYASRGWHDSESDKVGLIIQPQWKEAIMQSMTAEESAKVKEISRATHPSYFHDEDNK